MTRYEERDGGVYIEMEPVALSRDIPVGMRWLFRPAVARFFQNALATTLRRTRDAVFAAMEADRALRYAN